MKSYHLTYGGGIDSLVLREHEIPKPGLGEVLVRVRATSLNAREMMILRGDYPLPVKPDVVAVSDGAGEVAVRNLTGGRGVDYVIEVGGAGTLQNSLKSVAVQGQIS